MSYTISSNFLTTSIDKVSGYYSRAFSFPWFINDAESKEDPLKQYINYFYDIYQKRLTALKESNTQISEVEEKKLRDSLESLIHAVKVWHETRTDKK